MAFCKFCGRSIPDAAAFCPECGRKDPTVIDRTSLLTIQDEPFSRQEFFSSMGSADAKKRIRVNRIALTAALILVVLWTGFALAYTVLTLPSDLRSLYIQFSLSRYFFSSAGLCILLMILTCIMKRYSLAIAALVSGVFSIFQLVNAALVISSGILLAAAVILFINTRKLEKEYRAYLNCAGVSQRRKKDESL